MEDELFQTAYGKFRREIDVITLLKDIRVIKAAVQTKVKENDWNVIKDKYAVRPVWFNKENEEKSNAKE